MPVSDFPLGGSSAAAQITTQQLMQFFRLRTDQIESVTVPSWTVAQTSTTKTVEVELTTDGDGTDTHRNLLDVNSNVLVEVIGDLSTQGWRVDEVGGSSFGAVKTFHSAYGFVTFDLRSPNPMPAAATYGSLRITHVPTGQQILVSIVVSP